MFWKVDILLFSSLLNIITASLGRVVGGSVVGGFNKTRLIKLYFHD